MYQLNEKDFFVNSGSAISIEPRTPQENFPEHSHNFEEIIIVSGGYGTHVVNDVPSNLLQNSVFFVHAQDCHLFENVDQLYLTNILFKRENLQFGQQLNAFLPNMRENNCSCFIGRQARVNIDSLISKLSGEMANPSSDSALMSQALLQQLVIELWRGKIKGVNELHNDSDKIIYVLQWLNEHYAEDLDVETLAEQFQLSPRVLSKGIKQLSKQSLKQNIHQLRINKATYALQ